MMDALPGETEDSRTSAVGRKRDLAAIEPSHEPLSDHSDDDAERSHKRSKQAPEKSNSESTQDLAVAGASLPPRPDLPQTDLPQSAPAERAVLAPPPMTWNKGVQSGLRTSFASRALSQSRAPEPSSTTEHKDSGDNPDIGNVQAELEVDSLQSPPENGSGSNIDPAIQPAPPTQPRADIDKSMSRKNRKKKNQVPEPDRNGKKAVTQNTAAPTPAPIPPREPRIPKSVSSQGSGTYKNGNGVFVLDPILEDDEQISLKDLTPELFARHFLATNAGMLENLSARHLRGAFSTYLNQYYKHLPPRVLEKARESSAKRSKSFTKCLDQARKAVNDSGIIEDPQAVAKVQLAKAKLPRADLSKADPHFPGSTKSAAAELPNDPENNPASIPMGEDGDNASPPASLELEREEGEMSSDAVEVELSDLEIEMLQKYFPSVPGSVVRPTCLACAGSNHKTLDCPSLSCKICGKYHLIAICPENVRCLKCRARGHIAKDCPEKLFNPPSEGDCCDLCQSKDHLENMCHMLWRSYKPRPEEIKRVRDIPISCYVCGASNHYGPECGLHSGKILSGGLTWSRANLQMYLDPSSSNRAICAGQDFSLPKPTKKILGIRGQADKPIMLDDSDDDIEFLHASVKPSSSKSQSRGINQQIHLAGNQIPIHGTSGSSYQARNAPRSGRSQFGDYNGFQDSARYGRERAFSPPPRFNDFHVGFNENDRYLPQAPARGEYRPSDGGRRPGQGDNNSRGGQSGRGRVIPQRGGGNGRGRKRGKNSK